MKTYKEFKETAFSNPIEGVEQYIVGLKNRLILMRPEEIEQHRQQLVALKQVLDRIL